MINLIKLKTYRTFKSIKQEDMAKLLGVGINTYNFKENGKTAFTLEESKVIADYFGTTVDELFFNNSVRITST